MNVPQAGTYYVWLHLKASEPGRNALVFGIDGSAARVSADVAGAFEWVRVETSDGSGRHNFELQQGSHTLRCGPGDAEAELDAVYLTNDPNPSGPGVGVPTKEPTATALPPTRPTATPTLVPPPATLAAVISATPTRSAPTQVPAPSGGCFSSGHVSLMASVSNMLLFLAPLFVIGGIKYSKRRRI